MSFFLVFYCYEVKFYFFFDNLIVPSSQVQIRVLNHEYRYWLFQVGHWWTYWWIHSGINNIYVQWFSSFCIFSSRSVLAIVWILTIHILCSILVTDRMCQQLWLTWKEYGFRGSSPTYMKLVLLPTWPSLCNHCMLIV